MSEIWKPVVGYEGLYSVSSTGLVRSIRHNKVMKQSKNHKGYMRVELFRDNKRFHASVHRLVASAFIGESADMQVNHKNGVKDDNRVDNLEWVDSSGNMQHAYAAGLKLALNGEKNPRAKLTNEKVKEIRVLLKEGVRQIDIAEKFGIGQAQISSIKRGDSWPLGAE